MDCILCNEVNQEIIHTSKFLALIFPGIHEFTMQLSHLWLPIISLLVAPDSIKYVQNLQRRRTRRIQDYFLLFVLWMLIYLLFYSLFFHFFTNFHTINVIYLSSIYLSIDLSIISKYRGRQKERDRENFKGKRFNQKKTI